MDKNVQDNNEKLTSSKRTLREESEVNEEVDETIDGDVDQESQNGPPKKKKKRNSWIWNHFTCRTSEIDNYEYAHCNYCTK